MMSLKFCARRPVPLNPLPGHRRARLLPVMAAAALTLAACGSSSADTQVASLSGGSTATGDSTSTTLSDADRQQALLDYAACMRENGVEMADPTFNADGSVQFGGAQGGGGGGFDPGSETFQAAQEACGDFLAGVQFGGPGGGGGFDRTAIQDAFNSFTACLRDEGVQVDDITLGDGPGAGGPGGTPPAGAGGGTTDGSTPAPQGGFAGGPGGGGNGGGPGGDFDPTQALIQQLGLDESDPAVTAAIETCQPLFEQAFNPTGSTSTTSGN